MPAPTLLSVKNFNRKHPSFPIGGLRHKIFHADDNGMKSEGVIVRDGYRVLLHEERFFNWLLKRSGGAR